MLTIIFTLVLIGIGLYLLETLIPIDPKIKTAIYIVVFAFTIYWLYSFFIGVSPFHIK